MPTQQQKSGGAKKYGRNSAKCKKYAVARRRYHSKLKRIKKSNGADAAKKYERGNLHAKRYLRRHGGEL